MKEIRVLVEKKQEHRCQTGDTKLWMLYRMWKSIVTKRNGVGQ